MKELRKLYGGGGGMHGAGEEEEACMELGKLRLLLRLLLRS